jgi:hypothetical protein
MTWVERSKSSLKRKFYTKLEGERHWENGENRRLGEVSQEMHQEPKHIRLDLLLQQEAALVLSEAHSYTTLMTTQIYNNSVRKSAAHKESSWEKSHVQEQGLMAGSNCQAGWGKMVQHRLWARRGFYRRERLRKLAHVR